MIPLMKKMLTWEFWRRMGTWEFWRPTPQQLLWMVVWWCIINGFSQLPLPQPVRFIFTMVMIWKLNDIVDFVMSLLVVVARAPAREGIECALRIVVRDAENKALAAELLARHDEEIARHLGEWWRLWITVCTVHAFLLHFGLYRAGRAVGRVVAGVLGLPRVP